MRVLSSRVKLLDHPAHTGLCVSCRLIRLVILHLRLRLRRASQQNSVFDVDASLDRVAVGRRCLVAGRCRRRPDTGVRQETTTKRARDPDEGPRCRDFPWNQVDSGRRDQDDCRLEEVQATGHL